MRADHGCTAGHIHRQTGHLHRLVEDSHSPHLLRPFLMRATRLHVSPTMTRAGHGGAAAKVAEGSNVHPSSRFLFVLGEIWALELKYG